MCEICVRLYMSPVPNQAQRSHRHKVFPPSRAGYLDNRIRRIIYRPDRLAERYIKSGSRVLDLGCGPGFFTREFAKWVGDTGTVIAVDVQEEMLRILRGKMQREGLMSRIKTHLAKPDTLGLPTNLNGTIDVAFALFVVHEVPEPQRLFQEISSLLTPNGLFFYAEPLFEVSGKEFRATLTQAERARLHTTERRFYFINHAAVLRKVPG